MATLDIHEFTIGDLPHVGKGQAFVSFKITIKLTPTEERLKIPFHVDIVLRERDGSFKDARPIVTNWVDSSNDPFREDDDDHGRFLHKKIYHGPIVRCVECAQ